MLTSKSSAGEMSKDIGDAKESKITLVDLTRSFIHFLKQRNGEEVDLSAAERQLGASKRRLYDVSNVLAGVGLIERDGKAKVKWVGKTLGSVPTDVHAKLVEQSQIYDAWLQLVDQNLAELSQSEDFQVHGWMTEQDILRLDPEGSVNLFALRGPPSMTIQIDQDGNGEHRMLCKTDQGNIHMTPIKRG